MLVSNNLSHLYRYASEVCDDVSHIPQESEVAEHEQQISGRGKKQKQQPGISITYTTPYDALRTNVMYVSVGSIDLSTSPSIE